MLILSRKTEQQVFIGDEIEIVVLEVRRGQVKLGFNAPRYLPIQRGEIHDRERGLPALAETECV
jgi:carbon storage regulator